METTLFGPAYILVLVTFQPSIIHTDMIPYHPTLQYWCMTWATLQQVFMQHEHEHMFTQSVSGVQLHACASLRGRDTLA